ncbi:MAG: UDP-N-acetylmuramate dehydrogenase [Candidatus Magasanikbacteria bacterium]|jgi:UDP-N-acetylmuramate dehydrogenase|nr:UDP-N-acetylmuramate dehydrogenase [Candidatus Magasanikbacteria bacterium]
MDQLSQTLKTFGKLQINVSFAKLTTFKIGGPARFVLSIDSTENMIAALQYLDGEGVQYMLLGGGSNMLAPDEGYDGVVIKCAAKKIQVEGNTVIADAGAQTAQVARESVKAGLSGFAWGVGVPGTIGGALRGNAGAMGKEMKDDVSSVEAFVDGEVLTLSNEECKFGYRHSAFKTMGGVILRVTLTLKSGDAAEEMKKALEALKYRNETQPKGFASTGCIFKNIDVTEVNKKTLLKHFDAADEKVQRFIEIGKVSAGWLIEQAGMKGKKVGNAEVSDVHGNFILNMGEATSVDVHMLIEQIKEAVYTKSGLTLEEEIYIV